jgi:hypothetical protein
MTASAANHLMKYNGDTVPWLALEVIGKGDMSEVLNTRHCLSRPVRMAGTGTVTTSQAYE